MTETKTLDAQVLTVKFQKLHPSAVLPKYAKEGDAGMDLTVTSYIELNEDKVQYGFGLAVEIPKGYVGLLFPRSSVHKKDLMLSNAVGVVDSGYRGEVKAVFYSIDLRNRYKIGERAVQLLIMPYPKVKAEWAETLSVTERGIGGYGSTGA